MPELSCEKFNGDLEQYQQFIDCFTTTIHNNQKFSDVDKFRKLTLYMENQRPVDGLKSLVARFLATATAVITLLQETYGKKSRIIMSRISKLQNLKVEDSSEKNSLRIMYNTVNIHLRFLHVYGIDSKAI